MQSLQILFTLIGVVIVAYLVLKNYNPIFIFFFSGIIFLMSAYYLSGVPIPSSVKHTEATFLSNIMDSFVFISDTFKKNLAGVGLIIMSVAGFAALMKHINASAKLAYLANKPLAKVKNKYLVLSGTFVVGMALKIVISSYAGLLILLLACIYPVLLALKIRPITAVSVLSLIALDYGPKDGNSINMAEMVGQKDNVIGLFLNYQIYSVIAYVVLIAVLIPFYFSFMDKRDRIKGINNEEVEIPKIENPQCPTYYIFLPWLPIVFLFAAYFLQVKLDVITANFISIAIVFILEYARHRNAKKLGEDMVVIIKAMADIFISVVSIIIAASVFAEGIKALGGIGIVANAISSMGASAVILSIALLSFIVYFASVIMGSGIAAFNAFGRLAPDIAAKLHIEPIVLVLPIEIASCLGRAASPIAGGILVLAGFSKISPIAIVKRTTPLLLVAMLVNIIVAWSFTW
ncbi:C4-dicarboxylate ABC transporter [Campylobacter sp. MIT 12-8780]|uniref:C4-dicarboxylate transporter DcuC n=1 Tax=unclassified Campylobacter TaxID=2593542 RepID=UPI00115CDC81|nr:MULTISPECIES: C4-dicarboxylate transporter DcuC [unclassified Campylobacter]NDJ27215.1 anaerobic C4-dicarboxylate transporter DcuC [Campylobacter sp. MIT 19-121]TQR41491.1 C4-dicarboxylate ABC transporter [Campylobacter sp. MIT 12-8780]